MYPLACLDDAVDAYVAEDYETSLLCLAHYRLWRAQGGVEAYPDADAEMRGFYVLVCDALDAQP